MSDKPLLVLAFSGGLDTSYCLRYFTAIKQYRVHTVIVDTGGFGADELRAVEETAMAHGAARHIVLEAARDYYEQCLRYLIFGNVLRANVYPLSVSAERAFQASAIARYARQVGADFLAHGSTGAGNDQVRFDMAFAVLLPGVPVLTPIRDQRVSRAEALAFLQRYDAAPAAQQAPYSINKGLWGSTVGGRETLTSDQYLPEEAFPTPVSSTNPLTLDVRFERGEPVALDGRHFPHATDLIRALNEIAQPFGIGRDIHVGDTIIGLKGRVGFEAAAAMIILKAHHALEKHTLSRRQTEAKDCLAAHYASMLHEGHFLEPAMRNIEVFLADTQRQVSGTVRIFCAPYRFHILGVKTAQDLMQPAFGHYGEMNDAWTGDDVRGFARIAANSTMIHFAVNSDEH